MIEYLTGTLYAIGLTGALFAAIIVGDFIRREWDRRKEPPVSPRRTHREAMRRLRENERRNAR